MNPVKNYINKKILNEGSGEDSILRSAEDYGNMKNAYMSKSLPVYSGGVGIGAALGSGLGAIIGANSTQSRIQALKAKLSECNGDENCINKISTELQNANSSIDWRKWIGMALGGIGGMAAGYYGGSKVAPYIHPNLYSSMNNADIDLNKNINDYVLHTGGPPELSKILKPQPFNPNDTYKPIK